MSPEKSGEPVQHDALSKQDIGRVLVGALSAAQGDAEQATKMPDNQSVPAAVVSMVRAQEAKDIATLQQLEDWEVVPRSLPEVDRIAILAKILRIDKAISGASHNTDLPADKGKDHYRRIARQIIKRKPRG